MQGIVLRSELPTQRIPSQCQLFIFHFISLLSCIPWSLICYIFLYDLGLHIRVRLLGIT